MDALIVRIPKSEAGFFYAVLESLEGLASYSTFPASTDDALHCRLSLLVSPESRADLEEVLAELGRGFLVERLIG